MLLLSQVPLLFALEGVRIVIVHCASFVRYNSLFDLMNERVSVSTPGVESRSRALRNERAFRNRTGREGQHIVVAWRQEEIDRGLQQTDKLINIAFIL